MTRLTGIRPRREAASTRGCAEASARRDCATDDPTPGPEGAVRGSDDDKGGGTKAPVQQSATTLALRGMTVKGTTARADIGRGHQLVTGTRVMAESST